MPRSHRSIKISHLLTKLLKMYKSSKNQRAQCIQPQIPEMSVQPEKFRKNTFWGGPLFPVGPVWSKNDRSIRPFRLNLIPSGGFSLSVQLLWCNCTQSRKFAIPRLSSYYRCIYLLLLQKKKIIQVKSQSVFESRLWPFPPKPIIARNFGQHGCQRALTHAQITQQEIKKGSRTYRKYGRNILPSSFS